jgi:acid stress-induced BolA-like protein IbaG/YrbA
MQANDIERLIADNIPGATVTVRGDDGLHFEALVIAEAFAGMTPVQQHRLVYKALGGRVESEQIHALALKTYTPQTWAQAQGSP